MEEAADAAFCCRPCNFFLSCSPLVDKEVTDVLLTCSNMIFKLLQSVRLGDACEKSLRGKECALTAFL